MVRPIVMLALAECLNLFDPNEDTERILLAGIAKAESGCLNLFDPNEDTESYPGLMERWAEYGLNLFDPNEDTERMNLRSVSAFVVSTYSIRTRILKV